MPGPVLDGAALDRMARMREAGRTYSVIARTLGCSESAVKRQCLRLAVEKPGAPPKPRAPRATPMIIRRGDREVRPFTPEEDAQILAWTQAGVSQNEIGRRLGRRHNSIGARLMTLARREARAEMAA